MTTQTDGNPFLDREWHTPHGTPPFDRIRTAHFMPAFQEAMAEHRREIDAMADNPAPATFENTIEALERSGVLLRRVSNVFENLAGSASNDELRAVERDLSPLLARHFSAIRLNARLFARIDALYQARGTLALNGEQARLLKVTHDEFVRAGAKLDAAARERFAEIRARLATLNTQFTQNVLADEDGYTLVLKTEEDLAGLPQWLRDASAQAARDRGIDGHVITLSRSSVEPFLTFSANRARREEAFKAWISRGDNDNETDNKAIIREILALRLEAARLLGFESFAHYRTDNTMAKTPRAAMKLLDEVWGPARARALKEAAEIEDMITQSGANHPLEPWDWRYYAEKVRATKYDVNDDEVKPYLSLDNMIAAQFHVASRLFGLTFHERHDVTTYHPDVRVWEVKNTAGEHVALFYGDYFARQGKRGGAWMSVFRDQSRLLGDTPLVLNNCNYNKPPAGQPALLSFDDARTLFHEFGHALHGMLSNVTYPSLAGTSVDSDFVEFPSQIYEHWLNVPEVLERFARHYETGAPMPRALLERVLAARNFDQGFGTVEYISSALVDLDLHLHPDPSSIDLRAFEKESLAKHDRLDAIEMRHRLPHFAHLFSGEWYAAGYYSYLWAAVLDNDGFAAFEEAGDPFDAGVAKRLYENVHAVGNSRAPDETYRQFRGRDPVVAPLLRNRGFVESETGDPRVDARG